MVEAPADLLPNLSALASLATDVSHRYLSMSGYKDADALHRVLARLYELADYSDSQAALENAFAALPERDKATLVSFAENTSLLSSVLSPRDPVAELDSALTLHWPTSFGFLDKTDAKTKLGTEIVSKIDDFVDRKVDEFWSRDDLGVRLDMEPLSENDIRLAAAYNFTDYEGGTLTSAQLFANAEHLRESLQNGELKLPVEAAEILQSGLNKVNSGYRNNQPEISIVGWLT